MSIFDEINGMESALAICEAIGSQSYEVQQPKLDPDRFKAYVKNPSEIEESTLRDIAAVIDGKNDLNPPPDGHIPVATPSTLDRLLASVTIVYITDNDFPVAAATLVDPTKKDYRGVVPLRYYSLLSGYNLDGRIQQEFFAVNDEYANSGVSEELRAQLNALDIPTFAVVDVTDRNSIERLARSGYQFIAQLDDETSQIPVQLWIDNAGNPPANPETPDVPGYLDGSTELP